MNNERIRTTLWARLAYMGALIMILTIAIWYYLAGCNALLAGKKNDIQAMADAKAESIASWRRERMADAREIADTAAIARLVGQLAQPAGAVHAQTELGEWLRHMQRQGGYRSIWLVDSTGQSWNLLKDNADSLSATIWPLAHQAWEKRAPLFSDPYRSRAGGDEISVDLIAPILANGGAVRYAFLLRLSVEQMLRPLLQWPAPYASGEILLERRVKDEVIFLTPTRGEDRSRQIFPIEKTSLKVLLDQPQSLLVRDYRGQEVLATLSLVAGCDWFLIAKVDTTEVLAERRTRSLQALLLVLSGFIFATMAQRIYHARRENWYWRQMQNAQACLSDSVNHMQELELIVEASPVIALLFPADQSGPLRYVSSNVRQLGYTADDFYSDHVTYRQLIHAEDWATNEAMIRQYLAAGATSFQHRCHIQLRDGSVRQANQYFSTRTAARGGLLLQVLIILG